MRNWDVQVLDEKGNVKYQSNTTGTEKHAKSLLETFEKKWAQDIERSKNAGSTTKGSRSKRGFY
ncbi:hypothetical protein I588_04529 [Enterococcus pallens ATCC BAA-351]|uniref:Uncharacterized protein n=2 Tax=Enterococcus pallens TaxID=160454 RepID=R2QE84_9ENTE|nr:hypothetical protein UAU_01724 [Enterococcus pallens ATCC BAA-351]EOU14879.1 hypothetical protein I588_04529 [Enterococcus pallens ATCC BAA-351]